MTTSNNYQTNTYSIISKVAYLAGVEKRHFEADYEVPKLDIFHELEKNRNARIIRHLSMLRTAIEQHHDTLSYRMNWDLKNLDAFPDEIPQDSIHQLAADGVNIIKANCKLNQYIININKLIADRINNCKAIFPIWVEWKYIKSLFVMPDGQTETGIRAAAKVYYANRNRYPYQVYLNWTYTEEGNILYNDEKFLTLLYAANKDTFEDLSKVNDASDSIKHDIHRFLDDNNRVVIVVDCENSDPYKLCATLKNLNMDKVAKILLCDDVNTTSAWDILHSFTDIPVEHLMTRRINRRKSVVDHALCIKVCQEHYINHVDAVVLFGSDSDYWTLCDLLDTVNYYVMVESGKFGAEHKMILEDAGIRYCYIDDFCTGNSHNIKVEAMLKEIRTALKEAIRVNVKDLLNQAYLTTRAEMSKAEREQFYERYIKSMRLVIGADGDLAVVTG